MTLPLAPPAGEADRPLTLQYLGYAGSIEPDEAGWHGRLLGITDVVTYAADTLPSLARSFVAAIDDYLQTCSDLGEAPCLPGAAP